MKRHKRICDLSDNDIIMLVNEYRDDKISMTQLAKNHDICKDTLGYIFKKLGVVIRRRRKEEDWERLADRIVRNDKI